jgi:hypothetical protein
VHVLPPGDAAAGDHFDPRKLGRDLTAKVIGPGPGPAADPGQVEDDQPRDAARHRRTHGR